MAKTSVPKDAPKWLDDLATAVTPFYERTTGSPFVVRFATRYAFADKVWALETWPTFAQEGPHVRSRTERDIMLTEMEVNVAGIMGLFDSTPDVWWFGDMIAFDGKYKKHGVAVLVNLAGSRRSCAAVCSTVRPSNGRRGTRR